MEIIFSNIFLLLETEWANIEFAFFFLVPSSSRRHEHDVHWYSWNFRLFAMRVHNGFAAWDDAGIALQDLSLHDSSSVA
jgi:hypothetical protein